MKSLAAILGLIALAGQDTATNTNTIRVDIHLQELVATVRDSSGKIRKGLRASDFIVEDDGALQKVVHFSDDVDAPISVGLLIDNSTSMASMPGGTVSGIRAATGIAHVFLRMLKPEDEVLLMSFKDRVSVIQSFTMDRVRLDNALGRMSANGQTGILEAIEPAMMEVKKAKYRKRALVVLTDAYYSGDIESVARDIRRAEVPIFTFVMRGSQIGLQYQANQPCTAACHAFGTLPPVRGSGQRSDRKSVV